ncbi:hypothetical protein H7Y40_00095 [Pedobacter sp.]|nr:hypothetical protein [Candidatus Saccharibacteria bacterium]
MSDNKVQDSLSYSQVISYINLKKLYNDDLLSMSQIARQFNCSDSKIVYWMKKYGIERRSISTAVYQRHNPEGDPFKIPSIKTMEQAELFGIGLGLYWGEGTKANLDSVRLGNTDPKLLKTFIRFLTEIYGVPKEKLRFGLQIFTDIDSEEALRYWIDELGVEASQFYRITVTISGSIGTYRNKSQYGVVTVYCNNKKLRDILVGLLPR